MFVVTGITGKVGGAVARKLLASGQPVRAVVRSASKGAPWQALGCDIAIVPDVADRAALAKAFEGASGVFLMQPPDYDPAPGFPNVRRTSDAVAEAIERARPGKIIYLSTVGAQVDEFNLLNNAGIIERMLAATTMPVAFLRAAWFMENAAWDVASARAGRIESFLQPLDRGIDMVSTRDIGRVSAELLREQWSGVRIVELSGPNKVSPLDIASGFAASLGHPVDVVAVPRATWEERFRREGMLHPRARIRMLDGFNEGWIDFERNGTDSRVGTVTLEAVLADLVRER